MGKTPLVKFYYDTGESAYKIRVDQDNIGKQVVFGRKTCAINSVFPKLRWGAEHEMDMEKMTPYLVGFETRDFDIASKTLEYLRQIGRNGFLIEISPEVEEAINLFTDRKVDHTTEDIDLGYPGNVRGRSPRNYQNVGVQFMINTINLKRKNGTPYHPINGDGMGLGKTIQSILLVHQLKWMKTVMVVCPKQVMENWATEIKIWTNTGDERFCKKSNIHPSGRVPADDLVFVWDPKHKGAIPNVRFVIINYDSLKLDRVQRMIDHIKFDLIIADEAHELSNPDSLRTKRFRKVKTDHYMFLTGTLGDKCSAMWSVCNMAAPKLFPYQAQFDRDYPDGEAGAKKLGTQLLKTIMIARDKSTVAKELPPYSHIVHPCEAEGKVLDLINKINAKMFTNTQMSITKRVMREIKAQEDEVMKMYNLYEGDHEMITKLRKEHLFELNKKLSTLKFMGKLRWEEISAERKALGVAKVEPSIKLIDQLMVDNERIVVWYHHKEVGEMLQNHYRSAIRIVDGSVSKKEDHVAAFNKGHFRLFGASIQACHSGMNLQAASTAVFIERSWQGKVMRQAYERIHRIGSIHPCFAHHMLFPESLDMRLYQLSASKELIGRHFINDNI